jgi:hypothetical protein
MRSVTIGQTVFSALPSMAAAQHGRYVWSNPTSKLPLAITPASPSRLIMTSDGGVKTFTLPYARHGRAARASPAGPPRSRGSTRCLRFIDPGRSGAANFLTISAGRGTERRHLTFTADEVEGFIKRHTKRDYFSPAPKTFQVTECGLPAPWVPLSGDRSRPTCHAAHTVTCQ